MTPEKSLHGGDGERCQLMITDDRQVRRLRDAMGQEIDRAKEIGRRMGISETIFLRLTKPAHRIVLLRRIIGDEPYRMPAPEPIRDLAAGLGLSNL